MRKLLCLTVFLFCLLLPAMAEEAPAVPEEYLGEWKAVLAIDGAQMYTWTDEYAQRLIITEDGFFTTQEEGAPRLPLTYDAAADAWYINSQESSDRLMLDRLWYPDALVFGIDANHLTYCVSSEASPVSLPYKMPANAYGGDWAVMSLYIPSGTDSKTCSGVFSFDFEDMSMAPLTITLPPFSTFETIRQLWQDAVSQTADDCPLRALQVYGYELRNDFTLLLVTQEGILELQRERSPELDPVFQEMVDDCVGCWYPDELSVGGIYLPASAMGIPDDPITIDAHGYVLLPDGTVTALRLEEGTLMLGDYPVSGGFSLNLADDVELDFISEDDRYRDLLCGDWQLIRIEVPALNATMTIDPAVTDVTLNIDSSIRCCMDSDEYRLYDTFDPTIYQLSPLYGDDGFSLTFSSLDKVQVTPESGNYTLIFTRIEEIEETEDE